MALTQFPHGSATKRHFIVQPWTNRCDSVIPRSTGRSSQFMKAPIMPLPKMQ